MKGFRLFERPVGAFTALQPLQVVGSLPSYQVAEPYEGRLDIVGAVGRCHTEIVEEDSYLPPGSYAYVDNFSQQVVLKWPAYHPPAPTDDEIINPDFQEGMGGWNDLQGNSWSVRKYEDDDTNVSPGDRPRPPGNLAAWMTGVGRGDHILESAPYPVEPGQYITARALWDQGPSNKDNNNLFTALGLYRSGSFIEQVLGDRIHDRTNRTRHWSAVDHLIQPGIDAVTIRLIAHRRNGRNREIIVDNVETSGLRYEAGNDSEDELYFVKFKVTDSANRVAYWSGDIEPYTEPVADWVFFHDRTSANPNNVVRYNDEFEVLSEDDQTLGGSPPNTLYPLPDDYAMVATRASYTSGAWDRGGTWGGIDSAGSNSVSGGRSLDIFGDYLYQARENNVAWGREHIPTGSWQNNPGQMSWWMAATDTFIIRSTGSSVFMSTDNETWRTVNLPNSLKAPTTRIAVDPQNSLVIFVQGAGNPSVRMYDGETIHVLPNVPDPSIVQHACRIVGGWVAASGDRVWRLLHGDEEWTEIYSGNIRCAGTYGRTVLVSVGRTVMRSDDRGDSFYPVGPFPEDVRAISPTFEYRVPEE